MKFVRKSRFEPLARGSLEPRARRPDTGLLSGTGLFMSCLGYHIGSSGSHILLRRGYLTYCGYCIRCCSYIISGTANSDRGTLLGIISGPVNSERGTLSGAN